MFANKLTRAVRPTFRQAGQVRRFADITSPDAPIAAAGVSTEPGTEPQFWGIVLFAFTVIPNLYYLRTARRHVEADQHNHAVTTGATQPNQLVGQH